MKLKGVCIHHDAGALGAAVPDKVLERRLRLLMELGVNAIRTSHNPPAPELLDLCDRLGLLVKDEAFDEFTPAKNKWVAGWNVGEPSRWGYADDFKTWAITDISDMVRRDRNHPSIIIWSIGNEVDYANDPFTHPSLEARYRPGYPMAEEMTRLGKPLVEAVKKLDPTRPVSAALATAPMSNASGFADILDIVGYNYQEQLYAADHAKYPNRVLFGSENNHSYANWVAVRDNPYISGQFLWTGIDYLGEARAWPMRGNTAGLLETTGLKKPQAWFRQSLWTDKPMVYICTSVSLGSASGRGGRRVGTLEESWNWPADSQLNVVCYTNCEEAQLTLNGVAIGTGRLADSVDGIIRWTAAYAPGTLKVFGL
jgi:beta-galactosidase